MYQFFLFLGKPKMSAYIGKKKKLLFTLLTLANVDLSLAD